MQKDKTSHSFSQLRFSPVVGSAVVKNCVLLLLVLSAYAPPGIAQTEPEVTEPAALLNNPAITGFSIVPRKTEMKYYPCNKCHKRRKPNPIVRKLRSTHTSELNHGDQRMWCLTCHKLEDRNYLTNLLGESVDFDNAPEVCASCHIQRYKDWKSGGHGKRLTNWQGERVIYTCTQCHDPHDPAIKARAPQPPPPVRKGLEHSTRSHEEDQSLWERLNGEKHE